MKVNYRFIILLAAAGLLFQSCVRHQSPYLGIRTGTPDKIESREAPLPGEGIRAEMRQEWQKAIDIYKAKLAEDPSRADLWERVAENEAKLGHLDNVVSALKKATALKPGQAKLFYELSRTYSLLNDPGPGFEAVDKAVSLEPDNTVYLEARARLANWTGNYKAAAESYRRLAELSAKDERFTLYSARADSWSGYLDRAAKSYADYIERHPEDREALVEAIKVQTWRGNSPRSLELLERYKEKFSEDRTYLKIKADVLARAQRPSRAFELLGPLLEADPGDYETLFSRAIALHYARRAREALGVLGTLQDLRPGSKETTDIRKFLKTPYRSNLQLYTGYYFDSDDLSILSGSLTGTLFLSPNTSLKASGGADYLRAENNAFKNIDGSEDAWHSYAWLGGSHRFSPAFSLDGYLGTAKAEDETTTPVYSLAGDFHFGDTFNIRLLRRYGYFIISPKAVSLGIKRTVNQGLLQWNPGLKTTLVLQAAYEDFSDDNTRWEAIFFPRYLTTRSEGLNLDLGFRGWWFGYDFDPGNGYWAPELFQSYMGAAVGYWKIDENNGVSFQGAAGVLKDNTMSDFVFGYSIDVEGIFGIYSDLVLKLRGSYLHNVRQFSGAFDAYLFTLSLVLRL